MRSVLAKDLSKIDCAVRADFDHVLVLLILGLGLFLPREEICRVRELLEKRQLLVRAHGEVLLPRGVLELAAGWRGAAAIVSVVPGIVSRAVIAGMVGIVRRVGLLVFLAALALGVAGLGIASGLGECLCVEDLLVDQAIGEGLVGVLELGVERAPEDLDGLAARKACVILDAVNKTNLLGKASARAIVEVGDTRNGR